MAVDRRTNHYIRIQRKRSTLQKKSAGTVMKAQRKMINKAKNNGKEKHLPSIKKKKKQKN